MSDDPRVGDLLGADLAGDAPADVVLIGFPSDEGVRRNGGRPGAAKGPAAIRRCLGRLTPDPEAGERFARLLRRTRDLGDIEVSGDLERDQRRLADTLAPVFALGCFAVLLGGGHETSYGHFLARVAGGQRLEILNWDAHPDVRELKDGLGDSGSPFRQALEDASAGCRRYVVAGLQRHSTAASHLDYVRRHGRAVWRDQLSPSAVAAVYAALDGPAMVSFDLDAVDQSSAPGVSAPAAGGMTPELWLQAAYLAGRSPFVGSADLVELNPAFDRDDQTARLAALTVWQILRGLAARPS